MFRAVQFLYAKALLVALLATSVLIFAESIHESVAVDMRNDDPAPVLIKRYLRSTAAVTMSDHGNELEERAVPFGVAANLEKIFSKAEWRWWELQNKSPESLFKHLKLNTDDNKLFKSPKFFNWVAFYMKSNPIPEEEAIMGILDILRKYYGAKVAFKSILAAPGIENSESFAAKCLDVLIESWKKDGKTEDEAFDWLMPGVTADQLFENPLFLKWANYAGDKSKMLEVLKRFDADDLTKAIFAEKKSKEVRKIVFELQNARWKNMGEDMKKPEDLFADLEYHGARTDPNLVAALMRQVKQTNIKDPEFIELFRKHLHDDAEVALMLASVETSDMWSVRGVAETLLKELFAQLMKAGHEPLRPEEKVTLKDSSNNALIYKIATDYETFYKEKANPEVEPLSPRRV